MARIVSTILNRNGEKTYSCFVRDPNRKSDNTSPLSMLLAVDFIRYFISIYVNYVQLFNYTVQNSYNHSDFSLLALPTERAVLKSATIVFGLFIIPC